VGCSGRDVIDNGNIRYRGLELGYRGSVYTRTIDRRVSVLRVSFEEMPPGPLPPGASCTNRTEIKIRRGTTRSARNRLENVTKSLYRYIGRIGGGKRRTLYRPCNGAGDVHDGIMYALGIRATIRFSERRERSPAEGSPGDRQTVRVRVTLY